MSVLAATPLDSMVDSLSDFAPRLVASLVLLVVGLIVSRIVGRVLRRVLRATPLDELGVRAGLPAALGRVGLPESVSDLLAGAIRLALLAVVVIAAISTLGVSALDQSLNDAIALLPRLVVAILLLLVGAAVARVAHDAIDRVQRRMDIQGPLAPLVGALVFAIVALMALAQVGVPTAMLTVLLAILVGGGALTVALAFGLGGRGVARELTSGRATADAFDLDDVIEVGDLRGRVVARDATAIVLALADGRTARVPHRLLLEEVVRVERAAPPEAPEPAAQTPADSP